MRSNVSVEVVDAEELATMRTGHFSGSYAIMHFSHVLCNVARLKFSVAAARTSDRRGMNVALVVGQRLCVLQHTLTPLYITRNSTHNQFL